VLYGDPKILMPSALYPRRMGRAFKDIATIFVQGDRLIAFKGDHSQRGIMMLYSMRG
jgi:hypothetical protein